jgi:hypothetical protein
MKTVIFSVRPLKETILDVMAALKSGIAQETAQISFATLELMLTVLTAKRWEIPKISVRRRSCDVSESR